MNGGVNLFFTPAQLSIGYVAGEAGKKIMDRSLFGGGITFLIFGAMILLASINGCQRLDKKKAKYKGHYAYSVMFIVCGFIGSLGIISAGVVLIRQSFC